MEVITSGFNIADYNAFFYIRDIVVICLALTELIDFFFYLPFVEKYKRTIKLFTFSAIIMRIVVDFLDIPENEYITLMLILIPPLTKIMLLITDNMVLNILTQSLVKEKVIAQQASQKFSHRTQWVDNINVEEIQHLMIERDYHHQKDQQAIALKEHDYFYFIHFLRLLNLLQLEEGEVFIKDSTIPLTPERSRFLTSSIMLL